MSIRWVVVFAGSRIYHMPYREHMPDSLNPNADRLTVCLSQLGDLSVTESWAQEQGRRPCRLCYKEG